ETPEAEQPGGAGESPWLDLDRELHVLSSEMQRKSSTAVQVGALVRAHWRYSSDFEDALGGNTNGLYLDDLRLWAKGDVTDFEWALSVDFANDGDPNAPSGKGRSFDQAFSIARTPGEQDLEGTLRDGWGQWNLGGAYAVRVGSFVAPLTLSTSVEAERLMFVRRSYFGEIFDVPDPGAMLAGNLDMFSYYVALQNGRDGTTEDLSLSGRLDYHLAGTPSIAEGALGAQGNLLGTIGGFYYDDGSFSDGEVFGADARLAASGISLMGEWAIFGEGWGLDDPDSAVPGIFGGVEESQPWSASAGYMLVPDQWELAVRWEELDNDTDDERLTAGLNWYLNGHSAKLQFNWVRLTSSEPTRDGELLQLGFTVGMGYDY
ncbi:MAG TPA: hypothetical protein VJP77_03275, partial [Planctomycetota bacterium]|nr:hypothetical protein [Planctomycetota bacterium]